MEIVTAKTLQEQDAAKSKLFSYSDLLDLYPETSALRQEQQLNGNSNDRQPLLDRASAPAAERIGLDVGWSCIPHPSKVHRGGEDVHIVSRAGGCTLTGVLDGVGGWAEMGVDPAQYPRKLAGAQTATQL